MADSGWFIRDRGRLRGPFSQDQLLQMYRRGQLGRFHDISQNRTEWIKASSLFEQVAPTTRVETRPGTTRPIAIEPASISQESSVSSSSSQWPVMTDDTAFSGDRPRSKSSNRLRLLAILSVPCVLIAGVLTLVVFLNFRNSSQAPRLVMSRSSNSPTIQSSTDSEAVSEAVGLVVVGFEYEKSDGSHGEDWIESGTCFAISKDGFLLTNRHVVEFADRLFRIKRSEDRTVQYARKLLEGMPNIKAELKPEIAKKLAADMDYSTFEPKIWVFFTRRSKLSARIVYLCDENQFDMAILKVDRTKGNSGSEAYFRLSSDATKIGLGYRVASLGFPGAERVPNSVQEAMEERSRKALGSKIETIFKENDFSLSYYEGQVSKVYREAQSHCQWISHSATISHGNSGGPLVNLQGLVVGINTSGVPGNGIFRSIAVSQLRDIIEAQVGEGFVFSDQ